MKALVKVESNLSLSRDMETKAIINTNASDYETYIRNKQIMLERTNKIASQDAEINMMKQDISDIKQMLTALLHQNKED